MARIARVIAPGTPHHITQRGNRRLQTFFCDDDYPWSSARAHLMAQDDKLIKAEPLLSMVGNWRDFLSLSSEEELSTFRKHERSGRPLGQEEFVDHIEALLERTLRPQKPGPKQKAK